MSCYKGLSKAEKKDIAIEIFKSLIEDEPVSKPADPVPSQLVIVAPHLMDGSVHNPSLQTELTDVIMPVVMREVNSSPHKPETCQKLYLSAEKGCNILEFNECTGTWQLAKIFGKLPIFIPDGVDCLSNRKEMVLGHTKSSLLTYFILPRNTRLVHSNGGQENTTLDHLIRFAPNTPFILEPNTPINYGPENDDMSFKRREITIDFEFI